MTETFMQWNPSVEITLSFDINIEAMQWNSRNKTIHFDQFNKNDDEWNYFWDNFDCIHHFGMAIA